MDLIDAALRCKKPDGRFGYVSPTYAQAKDVAWGYFRRFIQPFPEVEERCNEDLEGGARIRARQRPHRA
jgi:hypothetical protein